MTALVRYLSSDLLRSHRFFPPLFMYVIAVAVLDAGGSGGPALIAYGGTALVLYPVGAWLTVVVANAEDSTQRGITVTAAGGWGKVSAAVSLVSVLGVALSALISTAWPALTATKPYPFSAIVIGFAAQLACGWTGVALGVLCARPVLRKIGWSALTVVTVVIMTYVAGRIPPVGAVIGLLSDSHPNLAAAEMSVLGSLAIAVALVVGATAVVATVARRRV